MANGRTNQVPPDHHPLSQHAPNYHRLAQQGCGGARRDDGAPPDPGADEYGALRKVMVQLHGAMEELHGQARDLEALTSIIDGEVAEAIEDAPNPHGGATTEPGAVVLLARELAAARTLIERLAALNGRLRHAL